MTTRDAGSTCKVLVPSLRRLLKLNLGKLLKLRKSKSHEQCLYNGMVSVIHNEKKCDELLMTLAKQNKDDNGFVQESEVMS